MQDSYRDRWLILAGSLLLGYFMVNVGLDDSIFVLWRKPFYVRDILGATAISALIWLLVRTATVWLDRRYDWFAQPLPRLIGQALLGWGLPVAASFLLAALYFQWVVGQPIAESTYPVYEFPISTLVILMINGLYFSLYLYHRATTAAVQPATPPGEPAGKPVPVRRTLIVSSGQRNVPLPTAEVAYFYIDEGAVYLTTFSGEKYLVSSSLDDLAQDLPVELFFRANRQFILHRRACRSYLNDTYGKLKVEVQPGVRREVTISQQRAPEFKKWLEEAP